MEMVNPLLVRLDEISPVPKYMQIVEQIRSLAAEGMLPPGMPLPSARQLASDLGINVNTVLTAYHALVAEDIIVLRHGSRAVMHPRLQRPSVPQPADITRIRTLLEKVRTDALLSGLSLPTLQELAAEVFSSSPITHEDEKASPE